LVLENIIPQEGLSRYPNLKIKLEVDLKPPPGFETEEKLLLKPFSFYVKCFQLLDLFVGKMHVLLFRTWKHRVKGRDWYDMEWYIKKGASLHLGHFLERARDSGDWTATQKRNWCSKVLGASVSGIVQLLSKDFLVLAGVSILIASPIAWWAMNKWLQAFAYRISISWWMFALAAFIAIFITLVTVSFQAIKAAIANPVKNLRRNEEFSKLANLKI
jgi:hypothetical protein